VIKVKETLIYKTKLVMGIYTKVSNGIKQHGLLHFIILNLNEQFYKYKFKKLGIANYEGNLNKEMLNTLSTNKDSKINQASPFFELKQAFAIVGIQYSEICLLDIGCGYGKVLNFGMMLNFNKVIGIDLDASATEKALENCKQMQSAGYNTFFEVLKTDATKFLIPDGINIIYLFNPFGKITMEYVVENILQYQQINTKVFYVIYSIAVHQDLFTNHKQFVKIFERLNGTKSTAEMLIFKVN